MAAVGCKELNESGEFVRVHTQQLFSQRQIPAFDPVNMLRTTRAPLLQGNRLEAATEFGAHAGLFRQRPDIVAHLQTMAEGLHDGSVTGLGGSGGDLRRFDQIRQPNGAAISTR